MRTGSQYSGKYRHPIHNREKDTRHETRDTGQTAERGGFESKAENQEDNKVETLALQGFFDLLGVIFIVEVARNSLCLRAVSSRSGHNSRLRARGTAAKVGRIAKSRLLSIGGLMTFSLDKILDR